MEWLVTCNINGSIDGRSRLIQYGLARILVSIAGNNMLTNSFLRCESLRILMNLKNETNNVLKERVVSYLGIVLCVKDTLLSLLSEYPLTFF